MARDGHEALAKLGESHYALVLMDCHMPSLDGYEATRMIRTNEVLGDRHLPVIAMTANALTGDRERCLDAGMDDYVAKPVNMTTLQTVLNRWIPQAHEAVLDTPTGADPTSAPPKQHPVVSSLALDPMIQPASTELMVLDHTQIAAIQALQEPGSPDILTDILTEFRRESLQLVNRMQIAVTAGDAHALHEAAHSLKSSSAYVGAQALSALCAELDQVCTTALGADPSTSRTVLAATAAPLVAEVRRSFQCLLEALAAVEPVS